MNRNSFAMTMRNSNKNLHTAAETTGFNARLIAGNATKESYAEFLFNLKAAYEAIERNLDKNINVEGLKPFVTKELYRSSNIEKDLKVLLGDKYSELELMPSALAYAARLDEIGKSNPMLVVAHAYTRFLADLFGGRTIYQIVKDNYKIEDAALNYYSFPELTDMKAYVMGYIENLDKMELSEEMQKAMLNEIANAYMYNIAISTELEAKLFPVSNATYSEKPAGHPHGMGGHPHAMPAGHPEVKPGMKMPEGYPHGMGGHPHGMPAGHPEVKPGMKMPAGHPPVHGHK